MTARGAVPQVVLVLLIVGALCVAVRRNYREKAVASSGDSSWRLTYTTGFHARKADAKLYAAYPEDTRHSHVFEHEITDLSLVAEPRAPPRRSGARTSSSAPRNRDHTSFGPGSTST